MNTYGERLRLRRKARCLSQKQLSQLIGVSGQSISKYEQYGIMPITYVSHKIADVLGEF